ncbi:5-hydroxytryptamine receptor 3A-like isoform X2 [Oreochromis aureus]|uniref:5-hydroxytryptamine receptor 3A-like isoform X2 n=1 Tax=Oreochromis aureus TaxID=47969 RepID=UPI001954739F|nr:5-hydroxytryptamine receptor 3A-like isoform X2 [Oreochromis aureus]XP_039461880.1 5-hydroxytryptamine receptor 3A-like isoform X2 [Oreochromis aureus]
MQHLYIKGQSSLYFLRRLRSFNICRKLLRMFYQLRRPHLLQNGPHPGLHSLPAHHERPAAEYGKWHSHHSLLERVIITSVLHHNSLKYREVPKWVRVLVLKRIANLICYRWPKDIQPPSTPQNDKPGNSNVISGPWIIQPASWAPDQHPVSNGTSALPELQQICQYLAELGAHLLSLQKESQLLHQWCHVGYVLDFLLFRIYLLLISCYAMVIVTMWCIWITQS